MTAVEWLVDNLHYLNSTKWYDILEQAKDMERTQLIECGNNCAIKQHLHNERVNKMTTDEMLEFSKEETLTFGEQYYNETFKNK
jgi:hypothetical protein